MLKIVIATNNAHKADEIANTFRDADVEFLTLSQAHVESNPVEDADTFEGNARIKAQAAKEALLGLDPSCRYGVLADDSGLEVDALNGAPGVFSSRYAGRDGDDEANNALLLQNLEGLTEGARTARFVCTMVFIAPDGTETVTRGTVEGKIGYDLRGDNGFGYDPLFFPDELGGNITFAEVTQDDKNKISHRGRALAGLRQTILSL